MRKILVSLLILVSLVGSMYAKTENSKNAVKPDKKWWKEAGDIEATEAMDKMVTTKTKLITCLAVWNGQDPADVATAAIKNNVALYGFTKPIIGYEMPAVSMYLKYPVSSYSYKGDSKNIAVLARAFKGLPISFVKK